MLWIVNQLIVTLSWKENIRLDEYLTKLSNPAWNFGFIGLGINSSENKGNLNNRIIKCFAHTLKRDRVTNHEVNKAFWLKAKRILSVKHCFPCGFAAKLDA